MTRFNRSARASLATAAVISAHTCLLVECRDYKYKVKHSQSTACCWILTQSRRPVSRTNGRRARGHGSRTGFPRERVRRPLRGDRPRESIPVGPPETPVVHPPNRPPSIHPSIHRRRLKLRPSALTPRPVCRRSRSPRRRSSRRFVSSWPRSSRATARTTGSCSSPCSSAPRSSCTGTISRLANGKARGAWQSPGAFGER